MSLISLMHHQSIDYFLCRKKCDRYPNFRTFAQFSKGRKSRPDGGRASFRYFALWPMYDKYSSLWGLQLLFFSAILFLAICHQDKELIPTASQQTQWSTTCTIRLFFLFALVLPFFPIQINSLLNPWLLSLRNAFASAFLETEWAKLGDWPAHKWCSVRDDMNINMNALCVEIACVAEASGRQSH